MMNQTTNQLVFIKLGGSLITDKNQGQTPRMEIIFQALSEIALYKQTNPHVKIILGHGSGSFGHGAARQYNTRAGVSTPAEWFGFAHVWSEARALNSIIMDACKKFPSLAAVAFPASATAITLNGKVSQWNLAPIQQALNHNLLPMVYGDVVFDLALGGTILSTEEIFAYLALHFQPDRILLAGIEPGVWEDFPRNTRIHPTITPTTMQQIGGHIQGSVSVDVTGGMLEKVKLLLALCEEFPTLQGLIFSGMEQNAIYRALSGDLTGTMVCSETSCPAVGNV